MRRRREKYLCGKIEIVTKHPGKHYALRYLYSIGRMDPRVHISYLAY